MKNSARKNIIFGVTSAIVVTLAMAWPLIYTRVQKISRKQTVFGKKEKEQRKIGTVVFQNMCYIFVFLISNKDLFCGFRSKLREQNSEGSQRVP